MHPAELKGLVTIKILAWENLDYNHHMWSHKHMFNIMSVMRHEECVEDMGSVTGYYEECDET